jgi:hypothetical protein
MTETACLTAEVFREERGEIVAELRQTHAAQVKRLGRAV